MLTGLRLFIVVGSIVIATACSQAPNQLSLSGPSAINVDSGAGAGIGGWTTSSAAPPVSPGAPSSPSRGRKNVSGVGHVANLRGSCEATEEQEFVSFVVQGVKVVTDSDTDFFISADETPLDGGCANLRNGTKVRVVAAETQNPDRSYTALSVTILDQPGGAPPTAVEGEGVVASVKGTCPSLTMIVHGYPVMTTSATAFSGGACEDLKPGTRVRVSGALGGNSVVADEVEILAAGEEDSSS
jgi:hypothetical protein